MSTHQDPQDKIHVNVTVTPKTQYLVFYVFYIET